MVLITLKIVVSMSWTCKRELFIADTEETEAILLSPIVTLYEFPT